MRTLGASATDVTNRRRGISARTDHVPPATVRCHQGRRLTADEVAGSKSTANSPQQEDDAMKGPPWRRAADTYHWIRGTGLVKGYGGDAEGRNAGG